MTTRKIVLTDTYQQVNTNPDFFIQCILGEAKASLSLTIPSVDDKYISLGKGDVLTSTLVDGTVWAKVLYYQKTGDVVLSVTE